MGKINLVVLGVNENRGKCLCKYVDDCGKRRREQRADVPKKGEARTGETSRESVQRIIEEMDADAGHAIFAELLNVRDTADEFTFERREGFNFLGNFQAKLKFDAFAKFEADGKIRAALGEVHGLRRMRRRGTLPGERDLQRDAFDEPGRRPAFGYHSRICHSRIPGAGGTRKLE